MRIWCVALRCRVERQSPGREGQAVARLFEEQRDLLAGVACRILGSLTDAEVVAQEAWLCWTNVDASEVANPQAFLLRVTSRLAIERLRRLKTRRGSYVGPWLPKPVLAGRRGPRPGVTLVAGGDRVRAPLRPVRGADKVADS